ncbi:SGNH hydrolase, partial [Aureobasidium melanogenum]
MVLFVHSLTLLLSLLPLVANCLPSPRHFCVFKPAYFLLVGDSTTATQSVGGGGWGDGFLNFTLREGSSGRNYGHNGATTKSFREGGDWDRLISEAKTKTADYTVYVTIQFGHNDQKPTSGVNLKQYSDNLEAFAREVSSIGAIPILVTSLTRRKYPNTTTPTIIQDLAVQRNLTIAAAHPSVLLRTFLSVSPTTIIIIIIISSESPVMLDTELPDQDNVSEDIWTRIKQLRIRDKMLDLDLHFPPPPPPPNTNALTESVAAAAQSTLGVGAVFNTFQSAAMAGYGATIVAGVVQVAVIAITAVAGYKLWNMHKRKHTQVVLDD